jgi:quercetin dioxygenase-like cupin family protein
MERINANDRDYRHGDSGPKYLHRGPNLEWGLIRLKPGDRLGEHGHREVEEIFYFPEGSPLMVVNGVEHRVRPGDAFRLEPAETHNILNDSEDAVLVVFIKSPFLPDDKYSP